MKCDTKSFLLYAYQIFNVAVSLSLFIVVYMISHGKTAGYFLNLWWGNNSCPCLTKMIDFLNDTSPLWSYMVYLLIVVFLTWIVIRVFPYLDDDEMQDAKSIKFVEESSYLFYPNLLAYFFVALSAQDKYAVLIVFLIMLFFSYVSHTMLYNPLFVLFNYKYYLVTCQNNKKILVITKKVLNPGTDLPISFVSLKRMNDNTFVELT